MTRRIICFLIEWRLQRLRRPKRRTIQRIIRQVYFPRKSP